MAYQSVFKRYELKYLLSASQKELLVQAMEPYMALDQYGLCTIRNIYYDTDSYRLVRRSLEKPAYKEKLRVRSYQRCGPDSDVFVELKKKYESVVYKRRVALPEQAAIDWLAGRISCPAPGQIPREIDYFRQFYGGLRPVMFLGYQREAYCCTDDSGFRVTFDQALQFREDGLSLEDGVYGRSLLEDGQFLMELKVSGGIPLWMVHFLTEQGIHQTSFSKYGRAYQIKQHTIPGGKQYA